MSEQINISCVQAPCLGLFQLLCWAYVHYCYTIVTLLLHQLIVVPCRYGPVHPMFFIGSLADAVKEATGGLAATRKPLLLYLHHDRSILSNVFCSQLLCSESIVNYLSLNFICWGWDLTTTQLRDQ